MPDSARSAGRRRSLRYDTTINAVIRTSQGARHPIVLGDLSEGGCAVTAHYPLTRGASYRLKINGMETLGSIAAWCEGQAAGLEFQTPLHPAVADHLARMHPPVAPEQEQEREQEQEQANV